MPSPSYYFTLFKKFQVIDTVPEGTQHGNAAAPTGGFNLTDPAAAIGASNSGSLLGATTSPADSPLWAILNSRAMGAAPLTPVNVGGVDWPTMPMTIRPAWTDFQTTPATNKLVDVFGNWISAGKIVDIPTDVIATRPAPIAAGLDAGVSLFVCSVAGDNGIRPGTVPPDFWASSLIFLVDPRTGRTVTPTQLSSSANYHLVGVVGNRGNTVAGRYRNPPAAQIEAAGWVMVWNTSASPAVQLPALTNLDPTSNNGVYEIYSLGAGQYEIVGFNLNVQDVFNGLARALEDSSVDLGGFPPEIWLHGEAAHLCAKVLVRQSSESWPTMGDTPFTNRRIGQKNLAGFAIDVAVTDPDPDIIWRNFMMGDTIRFMALMGRFDNRWGQHRLVIRAKLETDAKLFLAIPRKSFERWFRKENIRGFKPVGEGAAAELKPPFRDYVMLAVPKEGELVLPPLGEEYLAMSLGIQFSRKKIKGPDWGQISIIQTTSVPKIIEKKQCYEIEEVPVGGFTLQLQAYDSREMPKRPKG